jgi:hypothetical protein
MDQESRIKITINRNLYQQLLRLFNVENIKAVRFSHHDPRGWVDVYLDEIKMDEGTIFFLELSEWWFEETKLLPGTLLPTHVNGELSLDYLCKFELKESLKANWDFDKIYELTFAYLQKRTNEDISDYELILSSSLVGNKDSCYRIEDYSLKFISHDDINNSRDLSSDDELKELIVKYIHSWTLENCYEIEKTEFYYCTSIFDSEIDSVGEFWKMDIEWLIKD